MKIRKTDPPEAKGPARRKLYPVSISLVSGKAGEKRWLDESILLGQTRRWQVFSPGSSFSSRLLLPGHNAQMLVA